MQGCSTLHRRWKGMGRVDLVLVLLVALSPGTTPYISVQVTPGSKPSLPAQEKQDNGNIDAAATPVALLGRSWTGPTCCNMKEGFEQLLRNGFAVFDDEDSMFRSSTATDNSEGGSNNGDGEGHHRESSFNAAWLKHARPLAGDQMCECIEDCPPSLLRTPLADDSSQRGQPGLRSRRGGIAWSSDRGRSNHTRSEACVRHWGAWRGPRSGAACA